MVCALIKAHPNIALPTETSTPHATMDGKFCASLGDGRAAGVGQKRPWSPPGSADGWRANLLLDKYGGLLEPYGDQTSTHTLMREFVDAGTRLCAAKLGADKSYKEYLEHEKHQLPAVTLPALKRALADKEVVITRMDEQTAAQAAWVAAEHDKKVEEVECHICCACLQHCEESVILFPCKCMGVCDQCGQELAEDSEGACPWDVCQKPVASYVKATKYSMTDLALNTSNRLAGTVLAGSKPVADGAAASDAD